jgi:hypothetical protein
MPKCGGCKKKGGEKGACGGDDTTKDETKPVEDAPVKTGKKAGV